MLSSSSSQNRNSSILFESTAAATPVYSPLRTVSSVEGYHRPTYQRNYSKVMVVPSLVVKDETDS